MVARAPVRDSDLDPSPRVLNKKTCVRPHLHYVKKTYKPHNNIVVYMCIFLNIKEYYSFCVVKGIE